MQRNFDFLVVGGGIAGVAVASELARRGSVLVLEREANLAYHTTGRSAAISMESYGNLLIRRLTCASREFFLAASSDMTDQPLWSPRGALIVGDETQREKLQARYQVVQEQVPSAKWVGREEIESMAPFMASRSVAGIYEPTAFDLDVHAIHSAFLRGLRTRGGLVRVSSELKEASRAGETWTVRTADHASFQSRYVINAAGAWADEVASIFGASVLGLQALQRTVVVVDPEQDVSHCPYVGTIDEQIFLKPDLGRLMVSPCDETPTTPCDALPDELSVAIAMDRLEKMTSLRPKRVLNRWAGLRVFASDRSPVIGLDPLIDGFVWCAALGGYGIQTAPAMARLCAALTTGESVPSDLSAISVDEINPLRVTEIGSHKLVSVDTLK
ncbi:NAD(P)/FAD-dependent oxidoreductase [Achromobacter sp.]|uniref:NAD(P)/FAD-dependent oxidoreductase n=1 Tax=Achromobacter sp. TaxID=134375 RepID=UPI003C71E74A